MSLVGVFRFVFLQQCAMRYLLTLARVLLPDAFRLAFSLTGEFLQTERVLLLSFNQ